MVTGLLQLTGNVKFLSAVYLLHKVLPALFHLSKAFQAGCVSFAAMGPALRYTLDELKLVSEEKNPLNELKKDLAVGARLSNCDLPPLSDYQEVNLTKLTNKYVKALEENTNNRFDESLLFLRLPNT